MKGAIEVPFNGLTTKISTYDSTKTNLGTLIKQYSGVTAEDRYAGPARIGMSRPAEATVSIPGFYPHTLTYSDTIDWVFLAENTTASPTRRIVWYEYNKDSSVFTWKGFITLTYSTATNHTIKGLRMTRDLYTTGTVAVSTTTVTGTGTAWSTSRLSVGSRIGFGSTDPTQISVWYQISAIGSDTSITLTGSAGTIGAGTAYVIEDLRCITTTTNATTTNGGLYIAKGLRIEDFSVAGTTIPAAVSTDNIKAVYWLADASTVTNITACGCAIDEKASWTSQNVYVLDTATVKVYVYNMRAALTLASGKDVTTNIIKTGNQAVTGTISNLNNGRIATLMHGPGSGVTSLYFVTTTRVYRAALSNITNGSTTWQSDAMVEVPPGGTATYVASATMSSVEHAGTIDRLIILNTGAAGARSYVTKYNTSSDPFDHIFLVDDKQLDQSTSDSGGVAHPAIQASVFSGWSEGGILYLARHGTIAVNNQIYTLPLAAHWLYAGNTQVLITPSIDTSNVSKFYKVYTNDVQKLGDDTFALSPEPYRIYYRTAGITDNSGGWTLLDYSGDLSAVSPTSAIQFKLAFRIIGTACIPARVLSLALVYEDNNTDSHYEPSVAKSSITGNTFGYRQSTLWSTSIPNMRIRLYNAATGSLIIDDTVLLSASGTWQYSSNGGSTWNTWNSSADAVGNYIRYVATSLPGSTRVRALLTQA